MNNYSYLKGDDLTRTELIERITIEAILNSPMSDEERAWGKIFELKHASAVTQFGRILAQKRGLDSSVAAIMCTMHDISIFSTGDAGDHAHKGALIAKEMLRATERFTEEEIMLITSAIHNHSDKDIFSSNSYDELVKDADVLDTHLYEGVHDAYVSEKSPDVLQAYFQRIKDVRKELDLPEEPQWDNMELLIRK